RYVDDARALRAAQRRQRRLAVVGNADQIDAHDRLPLRRLGLRDRRIIAQPRVVHEHIEAAECVKRALDLPRGPPRISHVGLESRHAPSRALLPNFQRGSGKSLRVHVDEHHPCPLRAEQRTRGGADARTASGDQRNLVCEPVQIEYTGWFKPSARCSLAHSCGLTLRCKSTPAARTRCLWASSAGVSAPACIAVAASYSMRRAMTIARSVGRSFSFS